MIIPALVQHAHAIRESSSADTHASTSASLSKSQTLSGCPSQTASDVKRNNEHSAAISVYTSLGGPREGGNLTKDAVDESYCRKHHKLGGCNSETVSDAHPLARHFYKEFPEALAIWVSPPR
mmetsp:Transcript_22957/g.73835  ORF Transcript_22957/g.73835 Transcript_22957/m.73835 type:complete len:122 (-) Transcript_22957:26-391(-)